MWKIILSIFICAQFFDSYVHPFSAFIIQSLNRICLNHSPHLSDYQSIYEALVCGKSPQPTDFIQHIRLTGLYHLLVVSGSHLIFLDALIKPVAFRFGRIGELINWFILSFFALTSGFAAPVVRSLTCIMLQKLSDEEKLFWKPHHSSFYAGVLLLIFRPEWFHSLSFQLSWMASLMISLPTSVHKKHFLVFVGLAPLLWGLQPQSPMSLFVNMVFSGVLGALLFPLSLICFVFTSLSTVVDVFWRITEVTLHKLAIESVIFEPAQMIGPFWLWAYIFIIHVGSHFQLRNWYRIQ